MGYSGHGFGSGRSGFSSKSYGGHGSYSGGSFYNARSGSYVSAARAHQHVGQSFGGYAKAQSQSSGNFYMRKGK